MRGSVDRVCIDVGGPIDFLAHVKAAREEPPFSSDEPTTIPFDHPRLFLSFLPTPRHIVFARLRFRVRHACDALRREYSSYLRFSIRVIRSGFCIVHHFAVYLMRKKAFRALIPLCITPMRVRDDYHG